MKKIKPKTIRNKKHYKKSIGKCIFCGEDAYCALSVHRITPGSEGGGYTRENVLVTCENCHRKIHNGKIEVDRYYESTKGPVLRVIINGEEYFV